MLKLLDLGKSMVSFVLTLWIAVSAITTSAKLSTAGPCVGKWAYLNNSRKCVKLGESPNLYVESLALCSSQKTWTDSRLMDLRSWDQMDFVSLGATDTVFWTNSLHFTPNFTSSAARYDNFSSTFGLENQDQSHLAQLNFICEASPKNSVIDMREFEITVLSSKSCVGLLYHVDENVSQELCSNSTHGDSTYVEIDFLRSDVLLTGIIIQERNIGACRCWIKGLFIVEYRWSKMWQHNTTEHSFIFNGNTSKFEFLTPFLADRIRIRSLNMDASCVDAFCLHIQLLGKFMYHRQKIQRNQGMFYSHRKLNMISENSPAAFGIPQSKSGCPAAERVLETGSIIGRIAKAKSVSLPEQLFGLNDTDSFKMNACYYNSEKFLMPPGRYCIIGHRNSCPGDFFLTQMQLKESMYLKDGDEMKLFKKTTFSHEKIVFLTNISFCCRSSHLSAKSTLGFSFSTPFYLFPLNTSCTQFKNTTVQLESIDIKVESTSSSYGGVIKHTDLISFDNDLHPYVALTNTSLHVYLCYYQPEYEADEIIVEPSMSKWTFNFYFNFTLTVSVRSKGLNIKTGVDANLKVTVSLISSNCSSNLSFNLQAGSALFEGRSCAPGESMLLVRAKTHKGIYLEYNATIHFIPDYNVLIFLNKNLNACKYLDNVNNFKFTDSLKLHIRCSHENIFSNLSHMFVCEEANRFRAHHIIAVENARNTEILSAIASSLQIPIFIFDVIGSVHRLKGSITERYMSTNNNFHAFLTQHLASGRAQNGIIIYQMLGRLSLTEYYTMAQLKVSLLENVIIPSNGSINSDDIKILKNHPNCSVFLFLNSYGSSHLLRKAIEAKVTPLHGYHWVSFSPFNVSSNMFLRSPCLDVQPPCHEAFKKMIRVSNDVIKTCTPPSASVHNILSQPVTDLTNFVNSYIFPSLLSDMIRVISKFLDDSSRKTEIPSTPRLLEYVDKIKCLPSGLIFTSHPKIKEELNLGKYNITCEDAWTNFLHDSSNKTNKPSASRLLEYVDKIKCLPSGLIFTYHPKIKDELNVSNNDFICKDAWSKFLNDSSNQTEITSTSRLTEYADKIKDAWSKFLNDSKETEMPSTPILLEYIDKIKDAWSKLLNDSSNLTETISTSRKCLPSGLTFTFHPKNFTCEDSWSGSGCNIPSCSDNSCNTTTGDCIAPEVCYCHKNWYGKQCAFHCNETCFVENGVCNDGLFGDGKCKWCINFFNSGEDCTDLSLIWSLTGAVIGFFMVLIIILLYIYRLLQFRGGRTDVMIEDFDEKYLMNWEDFETTKEVLFSSKFGKELVSKKLHHTSYKKGTTYGGHNMFIKTYNRQFTMSLDMKAEFKKIKNLQHHNIENLLGVILGDKKISVVTNVASMGSLYDIINQEHIPITWDVKYSILQDICRGMIYLHRDVGIQHGALKSPNCLLHQGWLVKLTDIGLKRFKLHRKTRKKAVEFSLNDIATPTKKRGKSVLQEGQNQEVDYFSLLWTAPEILSSGITSLDQVHEQSNEAEIYSFGIMIAELVNGHAPFKECTIMSTAHIVQAIGHILEAIPNLGQLISKNSQEDSTKGKDQLARDVLLRPIVPESKLPSDDIERSIITALMKSCWSEAASERPLFEQILEILESLSPLKGSQTYKRALLLQRETESLEEYISHDTQQLLLESEKYNDILSHVIPKSIADMLNEQKTWHPKHYDNITLMLLRISNISEIVAACNPNEALEVLQCVLKAIHAIIARRKCNITELYHQGDSYMIGSGFPVTNDDRHAYQIVTVATNIITAVHSFGLPTHPLLKVAVKVGVHTGDGVAGIVYRSGVPTYKVVGDVVDTVISMEKEALPYTVHATRNTVRLLSMYDFEIIGRTSFKMRIDNHLYKTYWIKQKN